MIVTQVTPDKEFQAITLGDLFKSTIENNEFYLLAETDDAYALVNLDGTGTPFERVSLNSIIELIRSELVKGHLIHYPKDRHSLTLN